MIMISKVTVADYPLTVAVRVYAYVPLSLPEAPLIFTFPSDVVILVVKLLRPKND